MSQSFDDQARVRALQETGLLDSAREARFDRFTRLASMLVGTPIALISLVDANRQWFKSCIGLGASETPREYAFCDHAIRQDGVMVIPDATADARFATNPLVTGEPHIRFYAGAPLVLASGQPIGTLCVIDTRARAGLSAEEMAGLRDLADLVVETIDRDDDARVREMAIRELQHRLSNMFGQVAGLITLGVTNEQTKEQYVSELRTRMQTLHDLNRKLASRDWGAGPLADVVMSAVLPVIGGRTDRLEITGDMIEVNARAAMTISLALSELAVNSVKHGALGPDVGAVQLSWTLAGNAFVLLWEERLTSGNAKPAAPGFGSMLLRKIAPRDLGGAAEFQITDGLLRYRLEAPLSTVV